MKISILLPDLRGGGAERVNLDLAYEFRRPGYRVEFVLMRVEGELLAEAQRAFSVKALEVARFRRVPLALARYLRRHRPDALLAAMWPLTVIAPIAQRLSGHACRVVVSDHNNLAVQYAPRGRLHMLMLRISMAVSYPFVDGRVAVSAGVARQLARLSGMKRARFEVIHNPVQRPVRPSPEALRRAEQFWPDVPGKRILSVGRLKRQKNHALMLRAFSRLARQRDVSLTLLGEGELEPELRTLAASLRVEDLVVFAGFHPDPTPFYRSADLFVLSSDYEGFGNVIIEALACGTPVVSTDCPSGPSEILENGRWGRLVPVGDVDALAKAMADGLTTDHDREALKCRAADFSPAIAADKYLKLLLPGCKEAAASDPGSA